MQRTPLRAAADAGRYAHPQVQLPKADNAVVENAKIREYLLSDSHPVGRFKAAFFKSLGFKPEESKVLSTALLRLAEEGEARPSERNAFGQKYVVFGTIVGPNGNVARVVSVWIVLESSSAPRFITAYPGG